MKTGESGFTLLELIVAIVLVAAVSAVLFSSFSSSGNFTNTKNHTAAGFARQSLEALYEAVRQDWWTNASQPLSTASPGPQPAPTTVDGISFTPSYTVTTVDVNGDSNEDYRKVTM